MAADLTVHPPLRLKNIALNHSAACVLDLTRIDEGGSAGMAPARFDWDRSQAEQDRAAQSRRQVREKEPCDFFASFPPNLLLSHYLRK